MNKKYRIKNREGFSLVELMISMVVLGFVLIAVAGIFSLFIKSSGSTTEYAYAQQNSRIALDCITDNLRQAGSGVDYFRGQRPIVHAGPYQIVVNANIDNDQTISGEKPLDAMKLASSPSSVPPSGTVLYTPGDNFDSEAETVAFTLDSNRDGVVSGSDRGDDPEENSDNRNLFVLKMFKYGSDPVSGNNEVRESDVAILRGPNLSATWTIPEPLFQYYYDHDDDPNTDDLLWGDGNGNGTLETSEITSITVMNQNDLDRIRKVKITTISESETYDKKYETNGGFMSVSMTSEVHVRNVSLTSAVISGIVFHDADGDGVQDTGETGIYGVEIQLAGQNRKVLSDGFGKYYFPLPGGTYTLQEVDPPGYNSTTANVVSVSITAGQTKMVNFGDIATTPIGVIMGTVFEDMDKDGIQDTGEPGIENVLISLDDGSQVMTDPKGFYSFSAKQGNYTVVETDPNGFSSTTPNSASAAIAAANDTVVVNYGDFAGLVTGTLEGTVFLDTNMNGIFDVGEEGLPNVTIEVSNGDTTVTNARGYYRFSLEPELYAVMEKDPIGYVSTTVNKYVDIKIAADTTVVRNFGDILEAKQEFVEIHISNTERVLSVSTADLKEDSKSDKDIVLGTALTTGIGNMLVFQNRWESSTTPVTELFHTDPDFRRDAKYNINAMDDYDFSGDGVPDVITGLDTSTERNIQIWKTETGGILTSTPIYDYYSSGSNEVMDIKVADLNADGLMDVVVGLKSPLGTSGGFEVFLGMGGGLFASKGYYTAAGSTSSITLSSIWAVETADVDADGDQDIIIGSHVTDYTGCIDIYANDGYATGNFLWRSRYNTWGAVNDLKAVDMCEDDQKDPDILAAITTGMNTGYVLLWNNTSGKFGIPDTTGIVFGPEVTPNMMDDYVFAEGEALSLAVLKINNDIYPDIAFGTRSTSLYTGDIYVLAAYGTLPSSGEKINNTESGEIISIDIADFNKDSRPDIVVGTRSSATQGKLVAYFGRS